MGNERGTTGFRDIVEVTEWKDVQTAMRQRNEMSEGVKWMDALLEYSVVYGDVAEAAPPRRAGEIGGEGVARQK